MHRRPTASWQNVLGGLSRDAESSSLTRSRPPLVVPHDQRGPIRRLLPKEQHTRVKKLSAKLIDTAAREPYGWTHTHTTRGEERRLVETLQNAPSHRQGPSMEKSIYHSEEEIIASGDNNHIDIPLGSFVEARRNFISTIGIVIGDTIIDRRERRVILTTSGEVWKPVREDISFNIPSVVPVDLVNRCDIEEFAASQTQIHARIEILKRLRDMERTIEGAYNTICQKSARIYEAVKSSDPEKWSQTTAAEVARFITPEPDIITVFATHKYMMNHPILFDADSTYETTQRFNIRPQVHVDEIQTIQEWLRRRDGPIQSFGEKARTVIEINKAAHKKSRGEPPSWSSAEHSWTPADKLIISFLQHSLRRTRTSQTDPYSLGQSSIVKAIDPTKPWIEDDTVHEILVDLGVLAPWQDLVSLEPNLDLDPEPETTSSRVEARDVLVQKALSSPNHKGPLGPEDFYPSDPLHAIRHDFGDMPVYVIDEARAEELDDGVSVEKIPSEPDNLWVHVHIADPASVIPPTHVLAKAASIQYQTAYFIHRSWSLFPKRLMHDPQHGLSLSSKGGIPSRVLTFSSKVNGLGEIVDYKVRAGIVRNINILTYDDVDAALGLCGAYHWYPFGGKPLKPLPRALTQSHSKDLRDLVTISDSLVAKRQREGVFNIGQPSIEITNVLRASNVKSPTFEPSIFRGFPTFLYSVIDMAHADSGSHSMVAEMMKLASRVASRFCFDHDTPILRRVSDVKSLKLSVDLQTMLDMRTSNGYVRHDKALPLIENAPSAAYSMEPKAHFGLGVPEGEGYSRVTSPLRRYLDLISHWQIHRTLLGSSAPPFDASRLSNMAISFTNSERQWRMAHKAHLKYWSTMLLKRWIEDTERGIERDDDPLQKLEATVLSRPSFSPKTRKYHVEVHIRLLGIQAALENLDSPDILKGTTIPVKVLHCRLGVRPQVTVVPK